MHVPYLSLGICVAINNYNQSCIVVVYVNFESGKTGDEAVSGLVCETVTFEECVPLYLHA